MFEGFCAERRQGNEEVFARVFGDAELRRAADQYLPGEVHQRIIERVGAGQAPE